MWILAALIFIAVLHWASRQDAQAVRLPGESEWAAFLRGIA